MEDIILYFSGNKIKSLEGFSEKIFFNSNKLINLKYLDIYLDHNNILSVDNFFKKFL